MANDHFRHELDSAVHVFMAKVEAEWYWRLGRRFSRKLGSRQR